MSFELQQTIRNNAQQLKQYVNDLYDWQHEMELKQKIKNKEKKVTQQTRKQEEQQFRRKKIQQQAKQAEAEKNKIITKNKEMIRDANTVQDYYKAWDKYNPDQQLKKLQEEQTRAYRPYNPYEDSKNYQRAKPKTQMVIKGSRNVVVRDPTSLKDKGNVHFKVCQYDRAIQCYTECINKILRQQDPSTQNNKKLLALVYSNRAMTYIKINERAKALSDCNSSLEYDNKYSKTYLRRADCLKKLGKFKQSLADYKKVKELSPNEPEAEIQIKKIQQFLKKRIAETQNGMIISSIPSALPGGYRIQIQQLQQLEQEQSQSNQQPTNYLQEL